MSFDIMWDEMTMNDLPDDLREIAEAKGMEFVRYLVEYWGGVNLYIPSYSSVRMEIRNRKILEEWNGQNAGALSKKYKISRRRIYDLLRDQNMLKKGQGTLFEKS